MNKQKVYRYVRDEYIITSKIPPENGEYVVLTFISAAPKKALTNGQQVLYSLVTETPDAWYEIDDPNWYE